MSRQGFAIFYVSINEHLNLIGVRLKVIFAKHRFIICDDLLLKEEQIILYIVSRYGQR